jgi:hypothetical protein
LIELPLQNDIPHFSERVTLDGAAYTLEFRWNDREQSWRFSLYTSDEDPIVVGLKLLPGALPLAWRVRDARMFPGRLLVVDTAGRDEPPGLHDLGQRVQVVYFTAAEIAAEGATA